MIFLRAKSCKQRQHPATIEWIDLVHLSMDYYIAAAKSLQSCPTLCDPIDDSPPGSPVPRILQARTLEQVAISFSNAWKWKVKSESEVAQLCPTPSGPVDHKPTRLLCPWDFPGSTGVGCHCLLQLYSSKSNSMAYIWMNEPNTTHKINITSQKDNHCDSTYIKGQKRKILCTV